MPTEVYLTVFVRSLLAGLFGFLIGWERVVTGSPVRARIIALAALNAAAITAMSMEMFEAETARILAGLVTGIGFLGAGVIMRSPSGEESGLTTAASIWAMSAIGIAVGSGHILLGFMLTFLVYITIAWNEWPLVTRLQKRRAEKQAQMTGGQQPVESHQAQ
jgi:putative Mg2+ transporter-C (MgtC) family protein